MGVDLSPQGDARLQATVTEPIADSSVEGHGAVRCADESQTILALQN